MGRLKVKIYSDKMGHPLDSFLRAQRVLEAIRYEIDQHTFDPSRYISADINDFRFETRIEAWHQSKMKEVEKGNLAASYTRVLRCYINDYYLPFFRGMDVREIRTYHIDQFYQQMAKRSLKYTKNIVDALENFFNTLARLECISKASEPSFPVIKVDQKAPKWVDLEGQLRILQMIPEGDRPIFTFLALQGVRPGEARVLKVKDLNLSQGTVTICRTFSSRQMKERTKGKVVRPRLINPVLLPMLTELTKNRFPESFLFANPRTGKHYSEDAMLRIWDTARKKADIDITLYEATRHSVASIAVSAGVSLKAIQDVLLSFDRH